MDGVTRKWIVRNAASIASMAGVSMALVAFVYQLKSEWAPVALGIAGSATGAVAAAYFFHLRRVASRPRVFISYAHKDNEFAVKLADDLRKFDVEPIIDRLELKVGDDIRSAVDDMIDRSEYFIVIISDASKASSWAQKEIEQATKRGKRILPVVLNPCSIPSDLSGVFYADFSKDYEAGLSHLVRTFKR